MLPRGSRAFHLMSRTYPLWLWPNLLSLDAPAVAVLWQGFIADSFHVPIAWPARATLALAVWAVYIADRLLDTAHEANPTPTARHCFHREHRKLMTLLLTVAVLCAAGLSVLQVRPALLRAGLLTGTLVLLYLAIVHRPEPLFRVRWISKEAAVALLFTSGAMLAPFLRSESKTILLLAGGALFLICWANVSLIEAFEWRRLRQAQGTPPNRSSLAIADRYGQFALVIGCYAAAIFIFQPRPDLRAILLATLFATFSLLLLRRMQARLSPAAFRVLADTALLTPICVWPFITR
jgi:hypothetical protein